MVSYLVQSGSPNASVGRAWLGPIDPDEPAPVGEVELVELPVPAGDVELVEPMLPVPVPMDPVVVLLLVPVVLPLADVPLVLRT